MKAKDIVMGRDYMKTIILAKHCSPETTPRDITITDIEEDLVNKQAEISFEIGKREGIKEVVEWIREHYNDEITIGEMRGLDCWNEKLKEWGIE